jgi:hypothetical protein
MAEVIYLKAKSSETISAREYGNEASRVIKSSVPGFRGTYSETIVDSASKLYPDLDGQESIFGAALKLLDEASGQIAEALEAMGQDDRYGADDAVQKFGALLPELFCCRSLGDSFGTVVISLFHGLENKNGTPISADQIKCIDLAIKKLIREPFLQYADALEVVNKLEESGLNPNPPGLNVIVEVLLEPDDAQHHDIGVVAIG